MSHCLHNEIIKVPIHQHVKATVLIESSTEKNEDDIAVTGRTNVII